MEVLHVSQSFSFDRATFSSLYFNPVRFKASHNLEVFVQTNVIVVIYTVVLQCSSLCIYCELLCFTDRHRFWFFATLTSCEMNPNVVNVSFILLLADSFFTSKPNPLHSQNTSSSSARSFFCLCTLCTILNHINYISLNKHIIPSTFIKLTLN